MKPAWTSALSKKSAEQWLIFIAEGMPEEVKKILGGLQLPINDELERLHPVSSTNAGVYARLVTSRYSVPAASDRYLYVGSASKYGSGLQGRVSQHIRKGQERLVRDLRSRDLLAPGRFVTLMTMKMDSAEEEHVFEVRRTVTLAEAILTIWLGATPVPWSPSPRGCVHGIGRLSSTEHGHLTIPWK
ncbi:hypothetical protein Z517_03328 [Fonsecaea pedrosoi CBS 271.37]|uniref:GIY-YIG domain-containing protein n=1 Tax=Fonsecaea pedrosoi CBS 271.37 TaxID=1442368 RepID=A0A0D2FBS9_9EURO|nr:uncharacterized protein Z517_03328 [Fonsecaea pedrosoi CBS 271.37]KIW84082.1 hypothetical protein Z517_03328 [Fonsecaea pedrosoi CBS 271.37]